MTAIEIPMSAVKRNKPTTPVNVRSVRASARVTSAEVIIRSEDALRPSTPIITLDVEKAMIGIESSTDISIVERS
jgi:hypothetical protein